MKIENEKEFFKRFNRSYTQADIDTWNAAIESTRPKLVKWEPRGGSWYLNNACNVTGVTYSNKNYRLTGSEFDTKQQAEKAAKARLKFQLLYKWLVENSNIVIETVRNKDIRLRLFDSVSFTIDLAEKIKSGEVEL
jgi:hypothetical protein